MKFDVIIGNPPYQLEDGAEFGSASPLYHSFIEKAIEMDPQYITMITPSRWFIGGKSLTEFREKMIRDKRLKEIVHYQHSRDCFKNVLISGGVNYFLWDSNYNGKCKIKNINSNGTINNSFRTLQFKDTDIFINDNILFSIVKKVSNKSNVSDKNFSDFVSVRDPFKIKNLNNITTKRKSQKDLVIYGHQQKGFIGSKEVSRNEELINKNKLFVSFAYGSGHEKVNQVINKPFVPEVGSVCSGTYLVIGPFKDENETKNVKKYMETKFFRSLVYALKKTQHGTKKVYKFVPIEDFSKELTDSYLYKKYNLSQDEINYIEENVKEIKGA